MLEQRAGESPAWDVSVLCESGELNFEAHACRRSVVVIVQLMTNDSPPPLVGVDLRLVWNSVLAFAAATAISVISFLISTFVKLGRTTS